MPNSQPKVVGLALGRGMYDWLRRHRPPVILLVCCLFSGCGFLPGFNFAEQPTLYYLPVSEVAQQVSCEIREFIFEYREQYLNPKVLLPSDPSQKSHDPPIEPRWVLSEDDAVVKLNLQTDETGYVNFTGINVAQVGLDALQSFILSSTSGKVSVPSLGAKATAKRTKNVTVTFSVAVKPNPAKGNGDPNAAELYQVAETQVVPDDGSPHPTVRQQVRCAPWLNNPVKRLFLKEWLFQYFNTINANVVRKDDKGAPANKPVVLAKRPCIASNGSYEPAIFSYPCTPDGLKVTSVELKSMIMLAVDVSTGAAPSLLGNGSVFILPINGLGLDYNPDYSHQIDLTLNICDNKTNQCPILNNPDAQNREVTSILQEQCLLWATLGQISTGMKPPVKVTTRITGHDEEFRTCDCNKCSGQYELNPEEDAASGRVQTTPENACRPAAHITRRFPTRLSSDTNLSDACLVVDDHPDSKPKPKSGSAPS